MKRILTKEIVTPRELRHHIGPENELAEFTSTRSKDNMWVTLYETRPAKEPTRTNIRYDISPIEIEDPNLMRDNFEQMMYLMEEWKK